MKTTTIVAAATAMVAQPIGIIRLSGPLSLQIAKKITKKLRISVRMAHFTNIFDGSVMLDHAVLLYFKAPFSFTGEDVVEFQTHGNPYVKERIIELCLAQGAQMARPGEFSERAFHNGKMSLDQVEAVADLIHANSFQAAKSAALSLDGALKNTVSRLQRELMALRVLVEASIDFSEEDIPTITQEALGVSLDRIKQELRTLLYTAKRGAKLQKGIKVALVGEPNVGKSTLMNAICQQDVSIVTDEAGTTRDIVCREVFHKGVCLSFSDTAGIRDTESVAESMGIERSYRALEASDIVLHVVEAIVPTKSHHALAMPFQQAGGEEGSAPPVWKVLNKIDLVGSLQKQSEIKVFAVSAKTQEGVLLLLDAIVDYFKLGEHQETPFSARVRQVDIINRVVLALESTTVETPLEMMAQDLREMQDILSEITGEVTNDDVLASLFSDFCIGK